MGKEASDHRPRYEGGQAHPAQDAKPANRLWSEEKLEYPPPHGAMLLIGRGCFLGFHVGPSSVLSEAPKFCLNGLKQNETCE